MAPSTNFASKISAGLTPLSYREWEMLLEILFIRSAIVLRNYVSSIYGRLAQLAEHSVYIRQVIGSSPIPPTSTAFSFQSSAFS